MQCSEIFLRVARALEFPTPDVGRIETKLVFQLTGAFAEFERTMIRQRIKAGLKRAVAQGVKLGRPKVGSEIERKVRKQLAKGVGILKVARSLGIGTGTVQRISHDVR
jgi:DNA invertase Pin-like site-specific DNA recombinase